MRSLNLEFWQDKTVFITGHTGFKGAWLCYLLFRLGAKVHGYSLAAQSSEQFFEKTAIGSKIEQSTIADIRNREALVNAVKAASPDIIFHLAAQPLVRSSYENPLYTFDVNVMGTANILDVALSMDTSMSVISITTDKVYQNKEQIWSYRETDPLGGSDPYSASKACAEMVIKSFMKGVSQPNGGKVSIASARAGNVIGGGDWSKDRLIPDFIKSARLGERLSIRNPLATRPWQHVLDCLLGYMFLAESLNQEPDSYVEPWNFGPPPGDEWSVEKVVNYLVSKSKMPPSVDLDVAPQNKMKEHLSLALDSTKATKRLNWAPRLTVREALDYTIREYNSYDHNDEFINAIDESINKFLTKEPLNVC